MRAIVIGSTKHFLFALGYGLLGIIAAALFGAVWTLNDRPALKPWHTTQLKEEYHQQMGFKGFDEYLQLEARLFKELDATLLNNKSSVASLAGSINRYDNNSLASPQRWSTNWNRSYEWENKDAKFGVLLLHGMSDSPYALSHFARHFKGKAHVLGLRLPGHGTLPSGLTGIIWPDLASAVTLATKHMKQKLKGKPLYVIGFSTGAALALNHELENIAVDIAPDYQAMIMLSPAIGLAPIAAMAKWQASLGQVLGQDKLRWNSIQTEYDPFKYQSFAVNAGDVVYQLSMRNQQLLKALPAKKKRQLPTMLSFQSVVDDTVSTAAVLEHLYLQLPYRAAETTLKRHELVIFDVNRSQGYSQWMVSDPLLTLMPLLASQINDPQLTVKQASEFELTLIESRPQGQALTAGQIQKNQESTESLVQERQLNSGEIKALAFSWPRGVYSLSHVALPFPVDDKLYGISGPKSMSTIDIGGNIHQGERGLFSIPAQDMLRQKWNPFYPYIISRIDGLIKAEQQ